LHPLWTNIWREYFSSAWQGEAEYRAEKAHVRVGRLSSHCGESQALHYLGETRRKLKLTVSPREKLISNSQPCPVRGRGWQLFIY
jgi:hypothetical protein